MNSLQKKAIEEKLSVIIQRIERIENKGSLSENDEIRLIKYQEQLHGADEVLTAIGYVREYHGGDIDESGKTRRSYYTLKKI